MASIDLAPTRAAQSPVDFETLRSLAPSDSPSRNSRVPIHDLLIAQQAAIDGRHYSARALHVTQFNPFQQLESFRGIDQLKPVIVPHWQMDLVVAITHRSSEGFEIVGMHF